MKVAAGEKHIIDWLGPRLVALASALGNGDKATGHSKGLNSRRVVAEEDAERARLDLEAQAGSLGLQHSRRLSGP